jgi:drug/metabolite transporter (DMT)-like permease
MGAREWAMLLALSVLWGGSFFFAGVAVRDLPAFSIVTVRVGVAAVALLVVARALGVVIPTDRQTLLAFAGMGLLNNVVPFCLIVWGQHHITSGLAAILNATTPLFTVLVAHALTPDERLTPAKMVGVVVGFAGAAVMVGPEVLSGLGVNVVAQAACLAAATSYAFAGIFGRRFRRMDVAPLATAAGQVTTSTLMLVPMALVVDHPWTLPMPGNDNLLALLGLGVLSTALAYVIYFRVLAVAGATNLLLVTFMIPVSAILLGVLVLGERLQPKHAAGLVLIGAGLAVIDGRILRAIAAPRRTSAPADTVIATCVPSAVHKPPPDHRRLVEPGR